MVVKPLRDKKTGQFQGSLGAGKHKVPTVASNGTKSAPSVVSNLDDLSEVVLGLIDFRVLDKDWVVRRQAAKVEPINVLVAQKLVSDTKWQVIFELMDNPTLPDGMYDKVADHEDLLIRRYVVMYDSRGKPKLSSQKLANLAEDKSDAVRAAVANNVHTSEDTLVKLSDNVHDRSVQLALLSNPHTPSRIIEKLALSPHLQVRESLASQASLTPEVCESLATDKDIKVRKLLARNGSLSINGFQKLSKDESEIVREALTGNINIPIDVLTEMANNDSSHRIKSFSKMRLEHR